MSTDPLTLYPRPPFKPQAQSFPGRTGKMNPEPDHGEKSYKGSGRLAGKTALITGADSGIGRAVAIAFAREGAQVALSYLDEQQDAEDTAGWVEKAGAKCLLLPGDISDAAHCREIVKRTAGEFGRLDVLVNNGAYPASQRGARRHLGRDFRKALQDQRVRPVLPHQGGRGLHGTGQLGHHHVLGQLQTPHAIALGL